ncbi:MAG TPA: hypothetical protein DCY35_07055 [Prolixibacteraceae bacterium]|nr:hypothetical protein [Prolixibacteraceae bacterium]
MKKNIFIIAIILLPLAGFSQNFTDALRYSSSRIEGTARAGGMGNAFGALGGDFTSVGINPAGLGIYRSGEFALTPNFGRSGADASYLGTTVSDYSYQFKMNNLSYVAAIKSRGQGESGLVNFNIAVGYNRLNDFNTKMMVRGANANASFMDYITENANWGDWSDFYEELAWKTDMLLYDQDNDEYWHDIRDAGYGQSQRKSYRYSGSMDEYTLGIGLNFSHKFYFGASMGIVDLYYKETTTLREWDEKGNIPYFDEFSFTNSLRTSGTGYNFKVGAIVRPIDILRLGISIATPTFFHLQDDYETAMISRINYDDGTENYSEYSPIGDYDYNLETPFKATFSGALVLGKRGLVSLDYEYLDYGKARFRDGGNGEDFFDQNNDIGELYKPVGNIRLGGEYRLTEEFSVRAGYENYPSAFNSNAFGVSQPNSGNPYQVLSAGLGYRANGFFFDVAYRASMFTEYNLLYPSPLTDDYPAPAMAEFDRTSGKVLLTLGFRF